jgi:hypothetical protein
MEVVLPDHPVLNAAEIAVCLGKIVAADDNDDSQTTTTDLPDLHCQFDEEWSSRTRSRGNNNVVEMKPEWDVYHFDAAASGFQSTIVQEHPRKEA